MYGIVFLDRCKSEPCIGKHRCNILLRTVDFICAGLGLDRIICGILRDLDERKLTLDRFRIEFILRDQDTEVGAAKSPVKMPSLPVTSRDPA